MLGEIESINVVAEAIKACGESALLKTHPLERILRDLQTYVRHENTDNLLATIGRASVGLEYDPNFSGAIRSAESVRSATDEDGQSSSDR